MKALLGLNARTLELFDDLRESGVVFEMHNSGLVFASRTAHEFSKHCEHFDALIGAGYRGRIELWERDEMRAREPALADGLAGALYARDERHVRPETLVGGLVDSARAEGVEVVERTSVDAVRRSHGSWSIASDGHVRAADRVVICAGVWSSALVRSLGVRLPVQAAKGYSVTGKGNGTVPRHPLYLAEAKIGCSPFGDTVRIAGTLELAGINLSLDPQRVNSLVRSAAGYLRDWRPFDSKIEWAGLRPLAPDGLPLIGSLPGQDGLYVATGHGMLGVTLAPATAALLSPLILERQLLPELEPFRPDRFAARTRLWRSSRLRTRVDSVRASASSIR